jgi:hypothetical protein
VGARARDGHGAGGGGVLVEDNVGWTPSVSLSGRRRRWAGDAGQAGPRRASRGRELRPATRRAAAAGGVGLLRGPKRAATYCWAGWAAVRASC